MASVDDRIVHMEFDNAAFERKISETISSIDKLNKSMAMKGAQDGLRGVSQEASKFNLGKVGEVIEGIAHKFSALGIVGITVLTNITNKAINAGLQMAKHLALDNIIDGFREYETNINSIQTILANTASKGTNLEQVNSALAKLNEYSDQTIYNFAQMAKNVGTFTAAGVDLETSVSSIKGIANVAAMSGSNAEQASGAMYQLSQAIAAGSLKLMDWNSVVNAGMGGEAFKTAIFETGKAMGTLKDVPMDQTFTQWEASGHKFRETLESGWVTTEVLTTALKNFTGDMTKEQIMAQGFGEKQAEQIMKTAAIAKAAATEIKTFTQLLGTVKEAIGTGWADSMSIIVGNFEEAKSLFTATGGAIGAMVQRSAKARNEVLAGWKFLGGRNILIGGIFQAVQDLLKVLKPLKDAFHEVFPPATAMTLLRLTKSFQELMVRLEPSAETIRRLQRIFTGFFSALKIGWTILKEAGKLIGGLFQEFTGAGSGQTLEFLAKFGDFFTNLSTKLVLGGGIHDWFTSLHDVLASVIDKIIEFGGIVADVFSKVVAWFEGIDPKKPKALEDGLGRIEERFKGLKEVWKGFKTAFFKVLGVLDDLWDGMKTWFSDLGQKISDAIGSPDFSVGLDAINTGLFGGIVLLIRKFLKDGISVDLTGGLADKIGGVFDELTGTLKSMQTKIKAEALMKIAEAIGVLTASVLVLSLIDSAALSKSLSAMAIGFGELMASFAVLGKANSDPKSAGSIGILATGLLILSGAILVLSGAMAILSTLDPAELATGIGSIALMLGLLIGTAKLLSGNIAGLFAAGAAMMAIALSMTIMAGAIKLFSNMSLTDLGVGMGAVAAGLLIIAGAMQLMPKGMALQGVGLIAVAVGLNILAGAVKLFSTLSWGEMAKGMVGIAGALLLIGAAMQEMPLTMPIIGAGLILVGIGLQAVAKSLAMMASLSWGEMAKGLVGITASLLILAAATESMTGAIPGAIAIGIVAAALLLMVKVVEAFGGVSWGDLLHGLGALALVLAALAIAALAIQPAIPAMLALGAALVVIGAGFALFGIGVNLVGQGFVMLAKAGKKGSEALIESMKAIGAALPTLVISFADGILELIKLVGKFAPEIAALLGKLLSALLDEIAKLIPKIGKVVRLLIDELLKTLRFYIPQLVDAGLDIILGLLQGVRDHIGEFVVVVGEIITSFLDGLTVELPKIVQSVADLFVAFFTSVAEAVGKVSGTLMVGVGISFLMGFWDGISGQLSNLWGLIKGLVTGIIDWFKSLFGINSPSKVMMDIGVDIITGLINGVKSMVSTITTFFKQLPGKIVGWIGSLLTTLKTKGTDLIQGFLNGINNKITAVRTFISGIARSILGWIGNLGSILLEKGKAVVQGFKNGLDDAWGGVKTFFTTIPSKIKSAVGQIGNILSNIGGKIIDGLLQGMKDAWHSVSSWLGDRAKSITDLKGPPKEDAVMLVENGMLIIQGLQRGMESEWKTTSKWLGTLGNEMANAVTSEIISPTITPVLDFTQLQEDSKKIGSYIQTSAELAPTFSFNQARTIASSANAQQEGAIQSTEPAGPVTFNQNIYAPEQLSTADIYKQTRNQITMAKEALSVP